MARSKEEKAREKLAWRRKVLLPWERPENVRILSSFDQREYRPHFSDLEESAYPREMNLIVPAGNRTPYELRREDAPEMIARLLLAEEESDIPGLAVRYGPLRNVEMDFLSVPHHWHTDTLEDWILLKRDVAQALLLLRAIRQRDAYALLKEDRRISAEKRSGLLAHIGISIYSDADLLLAEDTEQTSTLKARKALAELLEKGLASARYIKRPVVLPDGAIVTEIFCADLYSAVWNIVEATVVLSPGTGEYRLRECFYCGVHDVVEGTGYEDGTEDFMREDKAVGLWYHDRCKSRAKDKLKRDSKNAAAGREIDPRCTEPGPLWYKHLRKEIARTQKDTPRGASK